MSTISNRDMPAAPAGKIDRPAPKGGDPLGNYTVQAHGMTKYEHVVLAFATAMVSGWHGDNIPEDAPAVIMAGAEDLADEYFKLIEQHRNR